MFEAYDVRDDSVMQIFIITCGDRYAYFFAFVGNFDDDLGCFQILYFLFDQLLPRFLFELTKIVSTQLSVKFTFGIFKGRAHWSFVFIFGGRLFFVEGLGR